jgi:hypothetical protein
MGYAGPAEDSRQFRPAIGPAHVYEKDGLGPRAGRLDPEQARGLAVLNATPEFLFGGKEEVLVKRVGLNGHFYPFATARDDRKYCQVGIRDPHIVLELRHVFFGGSFLRERPGQHEFGLENLAAGITRPSSVAAIRLWTGC